MAPMFREAGHSVLQNGSAEPGRMEPLNQGKVRNLSSAGGGAIMVNNIFHGKSPHFALSFNSNEYKTNTT